MMTILKKLKMLNTPSRIATSKETKPPKTMHVLTRGRRCRRINEDLMTTAESSPSGQDDDANKTASPPPVTKSSTGFFAVEDDLDL
jgi:hypothetical protein